MTKPDFSIFEKQVTARKKSLSKKTQKLKRLKDKELDNIFLLLHQEAFEKIDCLECARCCTRLGPRLTNRDISRMATSLRMKESDFSARYIKTDEDGDLVFKSMPCPFLQDDNKCLVYTNRPKACREYPHTDQKKIKSVLHLMLKNVETCPAVLYILNKADI